MPAHLRPSRGKDDVGTWDFIFDRTSDGRSLKWLNLVYEYTGECLALEARRGMTADRDPRHPRRGRDATRWPAAPGLRIFNIVCSKHFGQVVIIPTTTQPPGLEARVGCLLLLQQADGQLP